MFLLCFRSLIHWLSSWYAGAIAFDVEYARWLEEHNRHTNELRAAINSHAGDIELRTIVDNFMTQFDDLFRLKGIAAKADVFHILSGMWKTPAERCFMWIGGFRSSEILKVRNFLFIYALWLDMIFSWSTMCWSTSVAINLLWFLKNILCLCSVHPVCVWKFRINLCKNSLLYLLLMFN